jgi:PhzF family phenazine biosynthesis protein
VSGLSTPSPTGPFAGNLAAVCLLDDDAWPDVTWMQQVAAEMNLSETAFAHPLPRNVDADWALRWFTPTVEVDLCGHATLATAHALCSYRGKPIRQASLRWHPTSPRWST